MLRVFLYQYAHSIQYAHIYAKSAPEQEKVR
jgi:hypothetical protein